jgi:uncharacterized membrane protein YjjB (DUF3815 family)
LGEHLLYQGAAEHLRFVLHFSKRTDFTPQARATVPAAIILVVPPSRRHTISVGAAVAAHLPAEDSAAEAAATVTQLAAGLKLVAQATCLRSSAQPP